MELYICIRENEISCKMYIIMRKKSKLQNSVYITILFKLKQCSIYLSSYGMIGTKMQLVVTVALTLLKITQIIGEHERNLNLLIFTTVIKNKQT